MQDTLSLPHNELAEFQTRRAFLRPDTNFSGRPVPQVAVRRILLPFDLSGSSVSNLRAVANFAARSGATIHLLHVIDPAKHPGVEPKSSRSDDKMAEAAERLLKHWAGRAVPDHVRTYATVRIGHPVDLILSRATAMRADLIVMATRASSGQELQRSTAERVSRLAPCPVLTIPEKCAEQWSCSPDEAFPEPWRTVLMPVDFSESAEVALSYASALAWHKGARLLLAHGADVDDLLIPGIHARVRSWATPLIARPRFGPADIRSSPFSRRPSAPRRN